MSGTQFALLLKRRFLPVFVTQALGAFNDNLYRLALIVLVTYRPGLSWSLMPEQLIAIASGLFILPFLLFSAAAGNIADHHDKARLIRIIKLAEIGLTGLSGIALWIEDPVLMLIALFLLGTQSAFFGPIKYSILPQHLGPRELIGGNGLVEAATFLAILLGSLIGAWLVARPGGKEWVIALMLAVAAGGYVASRAIPPAPPQCDGRAKTTGLLREISEVLVPALRQPGILWSMLGVSWFWFMGGVYVSQLATFARFVGADPGVVTLLLAIFSLGVGGGALLCNALLRGRVTTRYVPLAGLVVTVAAVDLFISAPEAAVDGPLMTAGAFLSSGYGLRVCLAFSALAIAGGIYSVPLYAAIQSLSAPETRSRTIAANNILNSLFVIAAASWSFFLLTAGVTIVGLYLSVALVNLAVTILLWVKLAR